MERLEVEAPAKINLGLTVGERREDGYHDIRSIMQTVSLVDRLHLRKIVSGIRIEVDDPDVPSGPDNLVYRAWDEVCRTVGGDLGVEIRIDKRIPAAAGLAGGSSDAAAAVAGLNDLYRLGIPLPTMLEIAGRIGSDVPFCLIGGAALVEGRGERLKPLPSLPESTVVLARPEATVSTRWAYANLRNKLTVNGDKINYLVRGLQSGSLKEVAQNLYNSFENLISDHIPIVGHLKLRLMELGALGACLTGSGPTVFGLFLRPVNGQAVFDNLLPGNVDVFSTCPYPARFQSTQLD